MADGFRVEERGPLLTVTLARPPVNVLDVATLRGLEAALRGVPARRELRALLVRSSLPGVFSAGMDVAEHAPERASEMLDAVRSLFVAFDSLPQSTVAAVDGRCRGGAFELLLLCDAVFATPASDFAFPEVDVGCFPPLAVALLPSLVGSAAAELTLAGATLSAAEAARLGLVTRVTEDPDEAARAYAESISGKSAAVVAVARRALREAGGVGFPERLRRAEAIYRDSLLRTEDAAEGVRAFVEKRKPVWKHR
ncbi:MAG TPA: enoyl-CoA hydratase/isomerase family protein [Vicinamibacteria bacterium]|nr:enoyl-CoA hydratase/isomerase family protein [Vicinamibacteria bacterium]